MTTYIIYNKVKRALLVALFLCFVPVVTFAKDNLRYVNMMIGSDGANPTEYGGTTPAVAAPFAMTQWCATTRQNAIGRTVYHYSDPTLIGFQACHQPAIWMGDYGFMTLMPQTQKLKLQDRGARLNHNLEKATPYYYSLRYPGDAASTELITTELTATSRAAQLRISYPATERALLFIEAGRNAEGGIEILPERNEIRVYNTEQMNAEDIAYAGIGPRAPHFSGYYVIHFSQPFAGYGTWHDTTTNDLQRSAKGSHCGGYVSFAPGTTLVEVRLGSSFISYGQAETNLNHEIPLKQKFAKTCELVRSQWSAYLNKVNIESNDTAALTNFYTALFRTLQYPREFSEYGRYYSAFDGKVHQGVSYNDYSLWDTFRAEHPWLQLIAPERVADMMQSLVQMYAEGGWLPKWPNPTYTAIMIGSHADAVIADAYVNGFRGFNLEKAYEALRKDAFQAPDGDGQLWWGDRARWQGCYESRGGLTNYLRRGWVASDKTAESVSRTLEFALDDYCVAQMAKGLGHSEDYDTLMRHARNYRHLYRPETGFFNARKQNGDWDSPDAGFTEGAKWTYQFCAMQDVPGLIRLMGGKEKFIEQLNRNFDEGHYMHSNEPGHHYAYLYDYCDRLDLVQQCLPRIISDNYHNVIDGLSGNDDCGQMSAWLLFSSLGFYPVASASGEYALGIPAFSKITMKLAHGRKLTVTAEPHAAGEPLTAVYWNGTRLTRPFLAVAELQKGGTLEFKRQR